MIQKDYILRLTQEVAQVLAKLLSKNWQDSLPEIEAVYDNRLPISREAILAVPPDEIADFLNDHPTIEFAHIDAYAQLLYMEGRKRYEANEQSNSFACLAKAQSLLLYLNEAQGTFCFERQEKLKSIQNILPSEG
ncbi:MAG: hypothetical protein AAF738_04700 [Bacteroidota bacterium]